MGYGVINEQGDLGLGFDPVSESEEKSILESQQENNQKEEKSDVRK